MKVHTRDREIRDWEEEILSLFPIPLYTSSHIYFEEDLKEMGLVNVLDELMDDERDAILVHADTLARIKPELAFHFLLSFRQLLRLLEPEDLKDWVRVVLDIFDANGLNPAREFILKRDQHPDFRRYWGTGTSLGEVAGVLQTYLHALGGAEIRLAGSDTHYTDALTIYLPERVTILSSPPDGFLLYKVMVTHKFGQLHLGTFRLDLAELSCMTESLAQTYAPTRNDDLLSGLSRFLRCFPDPTLAEDVFCLAETVRIERWIADTLPGLYRELGRLKRQLGLIRELPGDLPPQSQMMEALSYWWLTGKQLPPAEPGYADLLSRIQERIAETDTPNRRTKDVAALVADLYGLMVQLPGPYRSIDPIPYVGVLRPEEAEHGRLKRRESQRIEFRKDLAKLLGELPDCEEMRIEVPIQTSTAATGAQPRRVEIPDHLLINGNPIPMPEALQKTVAEIYEDLGSIPSSYLAISDDMSRHAFSSLCQMPAGTAYVLSEHGEGIHALDEWDYRRQGYRKRWALLREIDASPGGLGFVDDTLADYGGMIGRIKRQFERIRMEQLLLRRQNEGDRVDLDAAVEAFADRSAGLHPSEKVFMRLNRDSRDIAAVFLIDLSGSTSGWINEMERKALLILSEAMQILEDRFAIFGFSGRTRRRCELYRVKGFDEPYEEMVKRRIANLRALEYTRLGPPIRYLTRQLGHVEARTKLLVTLSDGKPDDYDGYRGDYGIEDTRQALLESKALGIHPFCITIDRAEHSYLSHMYGAVNYAFIDDIAQLPIKIPDIYRRLTT